MLVAKPFYSYDYLSQGAPHTAPRVISEVRKVPAITAIVNAGEPLKARISGNLLVSIGLDASCSSRRVIIRGGYIHVTALLQSSPGFRLPLRHLSIRAGSIPHSLCLVKGQTVLLTLTIPTDRLFEIWLKTLAIEIIRQTPLEAVKYLDILTLTDPKYHTTQKQQEHDLITNEPCQICPDGTSTLTDINRNNLRDSSIIPNTKVECQRVAVLLQKCQSAESYVPVKEKLVLFESLCRIGRVNCPRSDELVTVLSSSVSGGQQSGKSVPSSKRARSMHDLSYCFTNAGVREICKYFETKSDSDCGGGGGGGGGTINRTNRRLIHSDSNLNAVRVKFIRNFEAHA